MESITREPIQKRSIQKKEQLLQAALLLFSQQGYHKVTTKMIAKEAGVAIGSFYAYFDDKLDVFIQLVHDFKEQISTLPKDYLNQVINSETIKPLLNGILDQIITIIESYPLGFHNQLFIMVHLEPAIKAVYESHMENIRLVVETLIIKANILPTNVSVTTLSHFITHMNEQLINLIMVTGSLELKQELKTLYLDMVAGYLGSFTRSKIYTH